jgi:hypothetical protein
MVVFFFLKKVWSKRKAGFNHGCGFAKIAQRDKGITGIGEGVTVMTASRKKGFHFSEWEHVRSFTLPRVSCGWKKASALMPGAIINS